MGKKGSWFSAIKRVFTHSSKDKPTDVSDKKSSKGKKKGKGILSHGENKSFIPLFREPSSIEKILGEADHLLIRAQTSSDEPKTPPILPGRPISPRVPSRRISSPKAASPVISSPRVVSPRVVSPPKAVSPKAAPPRKSFTAGASSSSAPPKVTQSRKEISYVQRVEPSLPNQHRSATMIQAAYRGYLARRSFRALKGLVRLQGVVRGQNVKRQTMSAMKQMQLLVRVQTQIQSRRIQMLENQTYNKNNNNNQVESTLSKWTLNQLSEAGQNEDWDDSSLTKEEVEARMRKKVEAVIKRERAMAYAYSNQLWKATPKPGQTPLDVRSNGFPWWWNWLERQLPQTSTSQTTQAPKTNVTSTPQRPVSAHKRSPLSSNYKPNNFAFENQESLTPQSARSAATPFRAKQFQTPTRNTPPTTNSNKYSRPRLSSAYDAPLKDDDSLMSCPPFSVPNYMAPTVSAKAKTRANSNPKERIFLPPGTPGSTADSKRRFSFPLTPNIGSFKWNKGGAHKDSASQMAVDKHESPRSIGGFSMGSAVSMPASVGMRKPFNRFV
ncbi:hypothetical protein ABFS83_14G289400 [Erythranthe nasuta]